MKKMPQRRKSPNRATVAAVAGGGTERMDMVRYAFLVGFGIAVCIWMWWSQPVSGKAAFVYILLAAGSLVGYVVFRWRFPKLRERG